MSKKKHPRSHMTHTPAHGKMTAVAQELHRAEMLLEQEQPEEAIRLLAPLAKRTPQTPEVLPLLASAYQEVGDLPSMALILEQYLHIVPQVPDAAEMMLSVVSAYLLSEYSALAVRALHHFLDQFPDHAEAENVRMMLDTIEPALLQDLAQNGMRVDNPFDFATQHEEAQIYLEMGDYATARQMEQALLRQLPTFVPAMNNLSQISLLEGNIEDAIAITRKALVTDPDNIHALSNLIHYLCVSGHRDEARPLADHLLSLSSPVNNAWVKQAEAFTYMQDDDRVWRIYQAATRQGLTKDETANPVGLHLAAVAAWRMGHERKARTLWKQALENDPDFDLAQANLDDAAKPIAERHAPWPFEMGSWLNPRTMSDLRAKIASLGALPDNERVERALRAFAGSHRDLAQALPVLLACGDPMGRTMAVQLASAMNTAETNAALQEFANSRNGPDELRIAALNHLTRVGVIPSGSVRMWIRGEWADLLSLGYEITDEPDEVDDEEVYNLYFQAIEALHAGDGVTAESALRAALTRQPDNPRLLHNLGYALDLQGRKAEARESLDANFAQHPDYIFARLGVASHALANEQIAEAEELSKPLLTRTKFHISEFEAYADFQVRLAIKKELPDAALTWIHLWESIAPESPRLEHWLDIANSLQMFSAAQAIQRRRRTRKKKS